MGHPIAPLRRTVLMHLRMQQGPVGGTARQRLRAWRASPGWHGAPLLSPRGAVQVGGEARPARIRVLDLPFTAVEWVLPRCAAGREPPGAERWLTLERSPLARERSLFGAWDLDGGAGASPEGARAGRLPGAPDPALPSVRTCDWEGRGVRRCA